MAEDGSFFDPAATLTADDPLRDSTVDLWIQKVQQDHPDIAAKLFTDPAAATKALADRGVPPPPMAYTDPMGGSIPDAADAPPSAGQKIIPTRPGGAFGGLVGGIPDPTADQGPYRLDPAATNTWRQNNGATTPFGPAAPPAPTATPSNPLDPETEAAPVVAAGVPVPQPRPDEAPKKKKTEVDNGLGDFAKTLAGVKALQPPPNPPVGTPAAPHANAMKTPDISQLLALFGQQTNPSPMQTLGRLLVAGKA